MEDKTKLLDPRVRMLIRTYLDVFGELPPPASCDKLVQMDLKLKPEFVGHKIRRRPYPAPKEQADEIERQIQECIDAGLVLEYKDGYYPQHCSLCFLVAKPGSTAKRLVVDYRELNKKTLKHSGSIPNMESTLEKIASCRYKTKMDKRSGFWQVDLTPNAQELLAFITPQGRVFKRKVMRFGVANAPALFQELMIKILSILRRRPVVQELISRGAQMEAHIDDVCLGTNTQEDHLILFRHQSRIHGSWQPSLLAQLDAVQLSIRPAQPQPASAGDYRPATDGLRLASRPEEGLDGQVGAGEGDAGVGDGRRNPRWRSPGRGERRRRIRSNWIGRC